MNFSALNLDIFLEEGEGSYLIPKMMRYFFGHFPRKMGEDDQNPGTLVHIYLRFEKKFPKEFQKVGGVKVGEKNPNRSTFFSLDSFSMADTAISE